MKTLDFVDFQKQFRQWRKVEIPFQNGRDNAKHRISPIEQSPYGIYHGRAMGVDEEILGLRIVPSHMQADNSLRRHRINEGCGIVIVVHAVDVNIVDVEQKIAVCLYQNGQQKIPFFENLPRRSVLGGVFNGNASFEDRLRPPYPLGYIVNRLIGERDRHQIIKMTIIRTVTQMFAVTADLMCI